MDIKKSWASPKLINLSSKNDILTGTTYFAGAECYYTITNISFSTPASVAPGLSAQAQAACGAATSPASVTVSGTYSASVLTCASSYVNCYASWNQATGNTNAGNCPTGIVPVTFTLSNFACS